MITRATFSLVSTVACDNVMGRTGVPFPGSSLYHQITYFLRRSAVLPALLQSYNQRKSASGVPEFA